jgi:hypothetical protein
MPQHPEARLGEVVSWHVDNPGLGSALYYASVAAAAVLLSVLLSGTDPGVSLGRGVRPRLRLPEDLDQPVELGLRVSGGSPWTRRPIAGEDATQLFVSRRDVWTDAGSLDGKTRLPFPARGMRVISAEHLGPGSSRMPRSRWRITVGDDDNSVTITGRWLALSFLGTVAGWPDPA